MGARPGNGVLRAGRHKLRGAGHTQLLHLFLCMTLTRVQGCWLRATGVRRGKCALRKGPLVL